MNFDANCDPLVDVILEKDEICNLKDDREFINSVINNCLRIIISADEILEKHLWY